MFSSPRATNWHIAYIKNSGLFSSYIAFLSRGQKGHFWEDDFENGQIGYQSTRNFVLILNMPLKFRYLNLETNQTPPKIEKICFSRQKYSYKKNYRFWDRVNADTKFRPWKSLSSHIITIPKNAFINKILAIQNFSNFRKTWKSPFWGLWSRLSFATYYTHWNQHHTGYIILKIWVPMYNRIDFEKVGSNSKFWFLGIKMSIFLNFITDLNAIFKCKSIAE